MPSMLSIDGMMVAQPKLVIQLATHTSPTSPLYSAQPKALFNAELITARPTNQTQIS